MIFFIMSLRIFFCPSVETADTPKRNTTIVLEELQKWENGETK